MYIFFYYIKCDETEKRKIFKANRKQGFIHFILDRLVADQMHDECGDSMELTCEATCRHDLRHSPTAYTITHWTVCNRLCVASAWSCNFRHTFVIPSPHMAWHIICIHVYSVCGTIGYNHKPFLSRARGNLSFSANWIIWNKAFTTNRNIFAELIGIAHDDCVPYVLCARNIIWLSWHSSIACNERRINLAITNLLQRRLSYAHACTCALRRVHSILLWSYCVCDTNSIPTPFLSFALIIVQSHIGVTSFTAEDNLNWELSAERYPSTVLSSSIHFILIFIDNPRSALLPERRCEYWI